jgi:3-(3-hydroxy-phenyl)propionate hydroxylase
MKYDVAIIGFGPVGAALAGLLGKSGLSVVVVEKDREVFPLPRAAHVDHTGLRTVQEVGCLDKLLPKVVRNKRLDLLNADRKVLLSIPADQESISALPTSVYFYQPEFDTILREQATSFPSVEVRLGAKMTSVKNVQDGAEISIKTDAGEESLVHASWVVGCDGAWSPVREAMEIKLESSNFDEKWLVVDLLIDEVAEHLPVDHAIEVCDPARPYLSTPIAPNRQRFEFMLLPDEDEAHVRQEKVVGDLLSLWFPKGGYKIERSAVYTFHGVVAESWRRDRILLAGDAAHQTPPFLGQGMCAGFRDASNLAWKLCQVIRGRASEDLLDTYEQERSPHAQKVIESAIRIGKVICELDHEKAAERDRLLLAKDPATYQSLAFTLPRLDLGPMILSGGGSLFIQPMIDGRLLDDVVGSRFLVLSRSESALGTSAGWWRDTLGAQVSLLADLDSEALNHWFDRRKADVVVVRPDRYVLGISDNLDKMTNAVNSIFGSKDFAAMSATRQYMRSNG